MAAFSQTGGVLSVFFLGGLMGSLTHCLVMCGPVVACQSACGGTCGKRMSGASQWQYHLGRLATYGALGFFAALSSKQIAAASYWPILSATMMVMAGIVFLVSALFPSRHALIGSSPRNGFLRGALMSFMPCGLLYGALMMAATLANPFAGMVAMWLFVLGTIPVLLVASGSAAILAQKWKEMMSGVGRFGMAFNGLALLVMAVNIVR
ncbi:MAG: sulfite exporter TauE/SafE family protein [Alphaproteobacteria bacterium]|nr:sulfite exporter TauE/SafE family protein [Alphaproteobacteria bacterium]